MKEHYVNHESRRVRYHTQCESRYAAWRLSYYILSREQVSRRVLICSVLADRGNKCHIFDRFILFIDLPFCLINLFSHCRTTAFAQTFTSQGQECMTCLALPNTLRNLSVALDCFISSLEIRYLKVEFCLALVDLCSQEQSYSFCCDGSFCDHSI